MSQQQASKIQDAVSALSEMEKELEQVKVRVSEMKRVLLSVAVEEAEKARAAVVEEASDIAQAGIVRVRSEAEKQAAEIVAKGEGELNLLRRRIDGAFEQAVDKVVKALFGV